MTKLYFLSHDQNIRLVTNSTSSHGRILVSEDNNSIHYYLNTGKMIE